MTYQVVTAVNSKGEEKTFAWFSPEGESIASWIKRWKEFHKGWIVQDLNEVHDLPRGLDWTGWDSAFSAYIEANNALAA